MFILVSLCSPGRVRDWVTFRVSCGAVQPTKASTVWATPVREDDTLLASSLGVQCSHAVLGSCRLWVSILARSAADPDFWYKVSVECGIDAVIIAAVNYAARGDSFFNELEFVFCNVRPFLD